MIQPFVDAFIDAKPTLRSQWLEKEPENYAAIVRAVIECINPEDDYELPNPNCIHCITTGQWQGAMLFVITTDTTHPDRYWAIHINYGSCSNCDTICAIKEKTDWGEQPTPEQVTEYLILALHIAQSIVLIPLEV